MSGDAYQPNPLDTSKIKLSDELMGLAELFAENAHEVWARDRIAAGWSFGPVRDDVKKTHPCLVPYKELPENEKHYDREVALETIRTLISLGYKKEETDVDQMVDGGDLDVRAREVLNAIKSPDMTMARLRHLWERRLPIIWYRDVQIYRRAVDTALRLGEAFLAFDISVEGLSAFSNDLRLIQLQALSLARSGATRRANQMLEKLRQSGHQDEETLGILARTYKDFWTLATDPTEKQEHLRSSFELYYDSYEKNGGYYSGINAATMGLLYGETEKAKALARDTIEICKSTLDNISPDSGERYWLEATLAEAALVMGDMELAREYYRVSSRSGMSSVVVSRTRSQARMLLEHILGNPHELDDCFFLPSIAVFSGHMYDRPGRSEPRFPYEIEEQVKAEVRQALKSIHATMGYSSLACGGDFIFNEVLLEMGGEVNIVLPFPIEDFKRASVDILPGKDFSARFDAIMSNAASVTILSELGNANDGASYDFCNQAMSGMAVLKSRFLGMDTIPVVVWDGKQGDGVGGTSSFVDFWKDRLGIESKVISLQPFVQSWREAHPRPAQPVEPAEPKAPKTQAQVESAQAYPAQEIKALIFTDIVGFTRLSEVQIPLFVKHFLGRVSKLLQNLEEPALYSNTWGDAVTAVFGTVRMAGIFALRLRDMVTGTDWESLGLPQGLSIRIALNAGPVFPCYDPVLKRTTFNGSHVNRTARIEPIAAEGQIYASQAFAALATADGVKEFTCDYVGTKQLAKKYGAIPVFLLRETSVD